MLGAWLMGAALVTSHAGAGTVNALRRSPLLAWRATCPFFFLAGSVCEPRHARRRFESAPRSSRFARAVGRAGRWVSSGTRRRTTQRAPGASAGRRARAVSLRWLVRRLDLACALAVLAKGLIGFVLPALVIGPWLLARGRWRQMLRLLHPLGLLGFVIVAAPWFVAMQLRYPGFNDYFFMEQHLSPLRAGELQTNVHPFWFLHRRAACGPTLPWVAWLPAALRRAWNDRGPLVGLYVLVGDRDCRPSFRCRARSWSGYVAGPPLAPWCALLAIARGWRRQQAARSRAACRARAGRADLPGCRGPGSPGSRRSPIAAPRSRWRRRWRPTTRS